MDSRIEILRPRTTAWDAPTKATNSNTVYHSHKLDSKFVLNPKNLKSL